MKADGVESTKRVFWFCWPTCDIHVGDLERAGIVRKDGLGRVVRFRSFRKTINSTGVTAGVNQRAAQEILGHPEANFEQQFRAVSRLLKGRVEI